MKKVKSKSRKLNAAKGAPPMDKMGGKKKKGKKMPKNPFFGKKSKK